MKIGALILLFSFAFVPMVPTQVTFAWNPGAGVDFYKLYCSPDITIPLTNWTVLTNVSGNNTAVSVQILPGQMWFYLTASNFWGESGPSNTASVPPIPGVTNLSIRKGP